MIRRTARLRREFIYRKSLEGKERELYEKKRTIASASRRARRSRRSRAAGGGASPGDRSGGRVDGGERIERGRRVRPRERARPEGFGDDEPRPELAPDAVRQGGEAPDAHRAEGQPRRAGLTRPRRAVPRERLHGPRHGPRAQGRAGRPRHLAHAARTHRLLRPQRRRRCGTTSRTRTSAKSPRPTRTWCWKTRRRWGNARRRSSNTCSRRRRTGRASASSPSPTTRITSRCGTTRTEMPRGASSVALTEVGPRFRDAAVSDQTRHRRRGRRGRGVEPQAVHAERKEEKAVTGARGECARGTSAKSPGRGGV